MRISEVYNCDRMDFLKKIPNAFFDLVIDEPPYGIGESGKKNSTRNHMAKAKDYKDYVGSDLEVPPQDYFIELRRVSKNQIIWGANHFISHFPTPIDSSCWLVWDKDNTGDFVDYELAWTSFPSAVRRLRYRWNGMFQENTMKKEIRIHPNQKPVALYAWILNSYAKQGYKICSPHMGSQSDRIATYKLGFDFWGCDKDQHYFDKGNERFRNECFGEILTKKGVIIQPTLFDE